MNTPPPSVGQRWLIAIVGVGLVALIISCVANCYMLQIAWLLGFLALLLEGVFVVFLWRNGIRTLFSRSGLAFVGWVMAGLLSLIVLFYAEENWRGRRAWAAVLREAAARGESLEFSSVFPPQVPEERNFARAPGVSNVLLNPAWKELLPRPRHDWSEKNWGLGQFTDLVSWRELLLHPGEEVKVTRAQREKPREEAAGEVLKALQEFEPHFQVLRDGAKRPDNRFEIEYSEGLFARMGWSDSPYEPLARAAELLCVRGSAHLALNQPDAALEDVQLALRLGDYLRNQPFWYPFHRRNEVLMRAMQTIWEGTALRLWTGPQLAALQQRLGQLDLIGDLRWSLRGETMVMMNLADQFQAWRAHEPSALGRQMAGAHGSDRVTAWLARVFYPTGWLYQDKAWMYRFYMEHAPGENPTDRVLFDYPDSRARLLKVTDPVLLVLVVPKLTEIFEANKATLYLKASVTEAILACALERYNLENGSYPPALQALVPGYVPEVPADPLSHPGRSYAYSRGEGSYVIYSVGANLVDDAGRPSPPHTDWRGAQYLFPRIKEGDWVWQQPPAKPHSQSAL